MDKNIISKRILEIRNLRGLSQAKLAKLIGKDRSMVSRYETGESGIKAETLYMIADALNVKINELFKSA